LGHADSADKATAVGVSSSNSSSLVVGGLHELWTLRELMLLIYITSRSGTGHTVIGIFGLQPPAVGTMLWYYRRTTRLTERYTVL